jgi:heterodisulfide reductase subunit B
VAAAILLGSAAALSQPVPVAGAAVQPDLPEGPGKSQILSSCTGCHALSTVTNAHYSAEKWGEVVDRMADRGAKVSDSDYDLIVAYLAAHYGPPK